MGKYSLIAADGSEFNIARNPDDPSTFHPSNGKSKRGFNMLHTVSLYDLISKRYLDVITQRGMEKNEFFAICQLIDRHSCKGVPIFIADGGLPAIMYLPMQWKKTFFAIRKTSTQGVFSVLPHLRIQSTSGPALSLPGQIQKRKGFILN